MSTASATADTESYQPKILIDIVPACLFPGFF